jgi:pimeloyl-ACP methyl ester carboxylesterase
MADATDASAAINDSGEQAAAALTRLRQQYQRKDFPAARGSDVLEFLVSVQLSHKQREAAAIKPLGKGTRLSPMILDTGIGYEIQSQYLHQHGDAVAHDAYVNGWGPPLEQELQNVGGDTEQQRLVAMLHAERLSANSGPWVNWLLKPPGIHQGVPWLEHNREEGKPFLCYETQIQQPGKYRADFPLRLAALASIQDWSWICWHYFQAPDGVGEEDRPFDRAMDVTTGSHPQGYHYTFDQVQAAMMRAAGLIFREREVAPVTTPTTFIYGRKSLYDPASMDYAGSYGMTGLDMVYTAYQYGLRIKIDPTREQDEVIGPVVSIQDRSTHNPYTPTGQITFDWKKGYLMMDAPAAVAWTGLLANYGDQVRFNSGVVLRNVTLENPQGIYDPVREDERYIAFALDSMDGKPLLECQRASLSLVSTSFNSGFSLAPNGDPEGGESGHLPVLKVAVGATVDCPALDGCRYTFRDWHMNPIGSGVVRNGQLDVPADADIFVVELER